MDKLVKYRLDSAKEKLLSAKLLLEAGQYKDSIGRSYYTIFTAIRAILALRQVDFSKHAGVIAYFQKEYIKTLVFIRKPIWNHFLPGQMRCLILMNIKKKNHWYL